MSFRSNMVWRMKRSGMTSIILLSLVLPLVAAQERMGNFSLRVEHVGGASSFSLSSLTFLVVLVFVLMGFIIYFLRQHWQRRPKRPLRVKASVEQKMYEEKAPATYSMEHLIIEDEIERHLKEEERVIVRLLRQREGRCEQGTLCIVSGFSKATLSRLLVELEMRGIILKEKQGKKNIVHLRI